MTVPDGRPRDQDGRRARRALFVFAALAVLVVAGVVAINVEALKEAFGSGPPHYGRSTNMDKWSNPVPFLVALDLAVLALLVGAAMIIRRKVRR